MHVHFIGIGGANMSALAMVALNQGDRVTGSDPSEGPGIDRLRARGATVFPAQAEANITNDPPDRVVVTAAIAEENPELMAARAAGVLVVDRADALGECMARHSGPRIAISGTHGKTSTTAMTASATIEAGLDPTVMVGGEYGPIGGNLRIGQSGAFVTEACEAFNSFRSLAADVAVVTNIEMEHHSTYGSIDDVDAAFEGFLLKLSVGGAVVWSASDTGARRVVQRVVARRPDLRTVATGWAGDDTAGAGTAIVCEASAPADGFGQRLTISVLHAGCSERRELVLRACGRHSASNALCALGAAISAGVDLDAACVGISGFAGVRRRFEHIGDASGVTVMDDYAHHPTEVRATLDACRAAFAGRRIVVAFQPHLYSRTSRLMDEFAEALAGFDAIIVLGIYAAREAPIPGVSSAALVARLSELRPEVTLLHIPDRSEVVAALEWVAESGDVVVTMGAGDVTRCGPELLGRLQARGL